MAAHPGISVLTQRELQMLARVAAGEPTQVISRRLGIAENTVKAHLTRVYKKTGSRNRVQAARHYLEQYARSQRSPDASRRPPGGPPDAAEPSPLIQRQIQEIEARLEELAPAVGEAECLRHALYALRAIEPD